MLLKNGFEAFKIIRYSQTKNSKCPIAFSSKEKFKENGTCFEVNNLTKQQQKLGEDQKILKKTRGAETIKPLTKNYNR